MTWPILPFGCRARGVVVLLALGACESTSMPQPKTGNVLLGDANNYAVTSQLTIPRVETASGTDLDICWPGVVKDIQCHDVSPTTDLDYVAMLRFLHLSEDDVQAKLTSGQLSMADIDGYLEVKTDHVNTCAKLSQFSFFGTPIMVQSEYVESADRTYMLLFAQGKQAGVGARSMTFVRPTATSTNIKVDGPSGCGFLEFSANLAALTPLAVPADPPWVIDWRAITRDGQGGPVQFATIDGVMLGFYQGMTVAELQAKVLDLELLATSIHDLPLTGGKTADLSKARDRKTGAAFAGFQPTDGVWVLALRCSTCQNPAPILLTVVDPGPANL